MSSVQELMAKHSHMITEEFMGKWMAMREQAEGHVGKIPEKKDDPNIKIAAARDRREKIYKFIKRNPQGVWLTDIMEKYGTTVNVATIDMNRLVDAGRVRYDQKSGRSPRLFFVAS